MEHYSTIHTPEIIQTRKRNMRNIIIIVISIVLIIGYLIKSPLYNLISIFVLMPFIILYPFSQRSRRILKKQFQRSLKEGKNRELIGRKEMEIANTGIINKTPTGTQSTNWEEIKNIYVTPSHAFIYTSDIHYIVPKSSVIEGDWGLFISELQKRKGSP